MAGPIVCIILNREGRPTTQALPTLAMTSTILMKSLIMIWSGSMFGL